VCEEDRGAYLRRCRRVRMRNQEDQGVARPSDHGVGSGGHSRSFARSKAERSPKEIERKDKLFGRLMTTKRPPSQLELDLPTPGRGEVPAFDLARARTDHGDARIRNLASAAYLMEAI
jgi:hypothetical protein